MAVPKRRTSKARKRKRRSHMSRTAPQVAPCPQCGTVRPTHVVCPTCGFYMGRTLIEPDED
ncbi:MAG: 50S ribosomal protein L32 [Planctomycetota bacterium]